MTESEKRALSLQIMVQEQQRMAQRSKAYRIHSPSNTSSASTSFSSFSL